MKRICYIALAITIAIAAAVLTILTVVKWQETNMEFSPQLVVEEDIVKEQIVQNQVVGGPDCPVCKAIHENATEVVNFGE